MITSKYSIREQNEATILNTIISNETISRAALSVETGLNKASVSSITKKLIDDDLVVETGIGDGSSVGGRKPILLAFNPKSALAISIDLGNNYIEALLSFIDGEEIKSVSRRRIEINKKNVLIQIMSVVRELEKYSVVSTHGIVGITIAIHGVVFENKIIFTPYYDLDQFDLAKALEALLDYPVMLENEANLAALAEYTFTSSCESLVSLSIHSGIGAGIVEDGEVQNGKHGQAGEIGHSILFPDGRPCPCGNNGCLEQYTSNQVLYREICELTKLDFVDSIIAAELYLNNSAVNTLMVESAKLLSIGINNIINLYDPEIVIVNNSIYYKIPELIEVVKTDLTSRFAQDVVIRSSPFGRKATLFGALAVTSQNFLNVKKLKIKLQSLF